MTPARPAHALVLDLDGVLRRWDPTVTPAVEGRHRLPLGSIDALAFSRATIEAVVTGHVSDAAWRAGVAAALRERVGPVADAAVAEWSASCGAVDADVLALVRAERRRRTVALLTNATSRLDADLARLGLRNELDAVYNSAILGLAKPDPRVFELVCADLGRPPSECLFVDDLAANVAAAQQVGMRAHHYRGPAQLAVFLAAQA